MVAEPTRKLIAALTKHQVLYPAQPPDVLEELAGQFPDPRALFRELVRRGWLTPFQANRLAQNRGKELVLGPYVLLDQLGSGGMGEVFKARHPVMDRVVAVKVIRADRLDTPNAVERFRREIQAAAKLSHPHVVHAYDAARNDKTHFFVMEYVEGVDLGKLVQKHGRLPVEQACQCVRQAALGLQHAHEHGLVHRDVKPNNLLLTGADGPPERRMVKVLDLGLARLRPGSTDGDPRAGLTQEGAVMGTPDYIAPEQAVDAGKVDIRADIYSLGCTLYFLLTGRPPFPSGTFMEKLLAHQQREPAPAEGLRPDLPPALLGVLRRMMAKKPPERYQTPAEVAEALAPFCPGGPTPPALVETVTHGGSPAPRTMDAPTAPALPIAAAHRRLFLAVVGVGGMLALAVLVLLVVAAARVLSPVKVDTTVNVTTPPVVIKLDALPHVNDPTVIFLLDDKPVPAADLQQPIQVTTGPHELVVKRGDEVVERRRFDAGPADADRSVTLLPAFAAEADAEPGVLRKFEKHAGQVHSAIYSADGRRVVSAGDLPASNGLRCELISWDLEEGREMHRMTYGGGPVLYGVPDGRHVLYLERSVDFIAFSMADLEDPKNYCHFQAKGPADCLAVAPGGDFVLAAGGGRVVVWDVQGRIQPVADKDRGGAPPWRTFPGSWACFSDGGDKVLAARGDVLSLWDLGSQKEVQQVKGQTGAVKCIALAPNNRRAYTAGSDGTQRIWDLENAKELHYLKGHAGNVNGAAFSPDGRRLLTAGQDKTLRLWDVESGRELQCFKEQATAVNCVAFSPGGRRALTGSDDGIVRLWALPK